MKNKPGIYTYLLTVLKHHETINRMANVKLKDITVPVMVNGVEKYMEFNLQAMNKNTRDQLVAILEAGVNQYETKTSN